MHRLCDKLQRGKHELLVCRETPWHKGVVVVQAQRGTMWWGCGSGTAKVFPSRTPPRGGQELLACMCVHVYVCMDMLLSWSKYIQLCVYVYIVAGGWLCWYETYLFVWCVQYVVVCVCVVISYACLCMCVCVWMLATYAYAWCVCDACCNQLCMPMHGVCVCMLQLAMHAYAWCVCMHVIVSYACLCMLYGCVDVVVSNGGVVLRCGYV